MRMLVQTLVLVCFGAAVTFPQSAANYTPTRTTGITFTPISSGSTFTWRTGAGTNDGRSELTNIGFDFWYMGTRFTQFNASTNGFIDLNVYDGSDGTTGAYDEENEKFFSQSLTIAPLYDNLAVAAFSAITYAVSGTFPSRVLTVEWLNADYSGDTSPDLSFQVKLYEGTGVVEFVYGTMTAGSAAYSYTIGIRNESATNPPSASQALVQQTANSASFSNTPSFSLSTIPESNSKIELTPPAPSSPTNLTFTSVKWSRMTLNWTDNATNELHYAVYRSGDGGSTFTFIDTLDPGTTSYTIVGLSFNTSYQWRVCAVKEGGLAFSVAGTQGTNAGLLNGTYSVGPTGTYATLTDANAAIRTDGVIGAVVFELQSTYTSAGETFPLNLLDSTWTSAVKTVTIRPASGATGLTISSSAAVTLRLNKANYFIIDGRPGGTGSSKELTIENTSVSGLTVEFKNMAANNTIRYCILKGVNTSTAGAVVMFTPSSIDDDGASNTKGNNSNTVTFNDIRDGASTPLYAISGGGLNGLLDSSNTFSYNNIYNFFGAAAGARGINYSGYTEGLTIIGNSFYQTASRTATGTSSTTVISVSGTGVTSVTIKDNYIGGSSASAGGTAWTIGPITQPSSLIGITISSATIVCSLQNNVFKNISLTTSSSSLSETFIGFYIVTVDTAYILNNTIGSTTGTGSLTMNSDPGVRNSVRGIYGISGSLTISNNAIGSITVSNASTSKATSIYGINIGNTTERATISGNTIGSTDTPNSIYQSNAVSVSAFIPVAGIYYNPNGSYSITNNTIANITSNSNGSFQSDQVVGIHVDGSSASGPITGNTVRSLTCANQNTNVKDLATVIGICSEGVGTGVTIAGNIIDSIRSTHASAAVNVVGLYYNGGTSGTNVVERNKITTLSLATSSTAASMSGISIGAGAATYKNNMVSIGDGLTTEYSVIGMVDAATDNNSFYYNTIRVGGTGVGTGTTATSAFQRTASGTDSVRNNIFVNDRSNSTTGGVHYAVNVSATTSLTSDYNNLSVGGTGGKIGRINTTDYATLANWRTGSGKDANSVSTSVTFASTTDLHLSGGSIGDLNLKGTPLSAIVTDYDEDTRHATSPYMGADENTGTALPVELVSFNAAGNITSAALTWSTATEINNHGFEVERRLVNRRITEVSDPSSDIPAGLSASRWSPIGFVAGNGTSGAPHDYAFTDKNLSAGKYSYRLKQIDHDGQFSYSDERTAIVGSVTPAFSLFQNYPNPFNPTTTIGFTLKETGMTTLKIFDGVGREVATLVREILDAGVFHQKTFDGSKLSSGIYLVQLRYGNTVQTRKLILLK